MKSTALMVSVFLSIFLISNALGQSKKKALAPIVPAAYRFDQYLYLLKNKRVGMVVNQTSKVKQTYLVDTLLKKNINITKIFAPEHGFRGLADAGEKLDDSLDFQTKLPLISIYGKKLKPDTVDLADLDIIVFDIQDVGARFYTYISTLQRVMEACAELKKPLLILDRPNPNGFNVDGPILDTAFHSFVGMQPVPVVHGMTMAEYAQALNGEGWLTNQVKCELLIVKCGGYTHSRYYELPVRPSPNIPNMTSVYLYPSVCLLEGTKMSVGRGTEKQFQVYGSPFIEQTGFSFVPLPNGGAKNPDYNGVRCYGYDLSGVPIPQLQKQKKINLSYLINAYQKYPLKDSFFIRGGSFFDKLAGSKTLREQIIAGVPEAEIRKSWAPALEMFRKMRKKYLLYKDF